MRLLSLICAFVVSASILSTVPTRVAAQWPPAVGSGCYDAIMAKCDYESGEEGYECCEAQADHYCNLNPGVWYYCGSGSERRRLLSLSPPSRELLQGGCPCEKDCDENVEYKCEEELCQMTDNSC